MSCRLLSGAVAGAALVMSAVLCGSGECGAAARGHRHRISSRARPDWIAFDRVAQVYTMSPEGGGVTQVTKDAPVFGTPTSPSWNPDGSRIVFQRFDSTVSRSQIFLIHADGTGRVRLTDGKDLCSDPRFSPNGKTVLFGAYGTSVGHYGIYSVSASGGRAKRLSRGAGEDTSPAWSPRGSRYAYIHYDPAQGHSRILIANADGSRAHAAFPSMGRYDFGAPAWSPDGRKIAFTRKHDGHSRIYVLQLYRKARLRELIHTPYDDFSPAWSPDGKRIAFCRRAVSSQTQVYIANADGTHARQISDGSTTDSTPCWRPHP